MKVCKVLSTGPGTQAELKMLTHCYYFIIIITIIIMISVACRLPRWPSGKESTFNAGDTRHTDSIAGSGIFPGVGMATLSSILAWKIQWAEEPGKLQSMGSQRIRHD